MGHFCPLMGQFYFVYVKNTQHTVRVFCLVIWLGGVLGACESSLAQVNSNNKDM